MGVCVICQTDRINRVLMPCRHACVCDICFGRLNNSCPMCRTQISTFFTLDGKVLEEPEQEPDDLDGTNWWTRANTRLNRMFGLEH